MDKITEAREMRGNLQMQFGLELLCRLLPDGIIGMEVGSYQGESASIFAKSGKFKRLVCVDMWNPEYYSGKQLIDAEKKFDQRMLQSSIIEKSKMDCNQIMSIEGKFDFIYIDGNHNAYQVKKDITNAVAILERSNGHKIIAGHDYDYKKSPDVKPAVIELLGKPDAIFCDYSWIKFL